MTEHKLNSLILGLDGATWNVLLPLIDLGVIPNIAGLVAKGARGNLRSTMPALTGPAWTTFMTGKNPGRHGFFDWGVLDERYHLNMWSNGKIADQPFWSRLSDAGQRVGVFNVPFTYPATEINGFIVSGMGTPDNRYQWAYPPELQNELENTFFGPGYAFSQAIAQYKANQFRQMVDDMLELEDTRTNALISLLDKHQLDTLVVVYMGTDRVGHFLGHRLNVAELENLDTIDSTQAALIDYFRALDKHIGKLLERVEPDGLVVVVSDHGFTTIKKVLNLNEWLLRHGYLSTYLSSWLKSQAAFMLGILPERFRLRPKKSEVSKTSGLSKVVAEDQFETTTLLGQTINWSRSQAFSNSYNGIYINTIGRFDEGIVPTGSAYDALCEAIIQDLMKTKDPLTNEQVVERVFRREEVYSGPQTERAPDLLVQFKDDRYSGDRYFFTYGDFSARYGLSVFRRPYPWGRGDHARDGILILHGPPFRQGAELSTTSIENVAPTILHTLGEPVPSGMTGQVITEALTDSYQQTHPVQVVDDPALKAQIETGLSLEEEQLIADRLRDLGYLE